MPKSLQILLNQSLLKKRVILLIDPDKTPVDLAKSLVIQWQNRGGAAIFVGSSLLIQSDFDAYVKSLKEVAEIPLILFPGDGTQISSHADAILLLSLVSGRNAEYLIGKHVESAFALKKSGIDIIPTAYMLIEGGAITSVQYMTQTLPIPKGKADIAAATALAAQMLGQKLIYLEAGSGAKYPVDISIIQAVKAHSQLPIIVGGGLRSKEQINEAWNAGADFVVVGTAIEENQELLDELLA